jgi:hypothetical protein
MKLSGLLYCKCCGVYELEGYRYLKRKTISRVEVYYWSNIPKRGLNVVPCPRCKDLDPPYDVVNTHYDLPDV